MIEAVLWDLGGVLCRFDPVARVAAMAAAADRPIDAVARFLSASLLAAIDSGELDGPALHGLVRDVLGWDCAYEELGVAWSAAFEPDRAVLDLAARLRMPAAVLTNNGPPLMDQFARLLPDVAAVVEATLCSAQFRATKPDPRALLGACQVLDRAPATILLVDDSQTNADGAVAAGMQALLFRTAGELDAQLRDLGLLRS